MVRTCQMFWVESNGASWRLNPSVSGAAGTAAVRECVLWPWKIQQSPCGVNHGLVAYPCIPQIQRAISACAIV